MSPRKGKKKRKIIRRNLPKKKTASGPSRNTTMAAHGRRTRSHQARTVEGFLILNERGFGFVGSGGKKEDDVYVPEELTRGYFAGDKVRVEVSRLWRGKERAGKIWLIERTRKEILGRLSHLRGGGWVLWPDPEEARCQFGVEGSRKGQGVEDGDLALLQITRFPGDKQSAKGKIIKVLGQPGAPEVEMERIIRRHELRVPFPRAALKEAGTLEFSLGRRKRRDLREAEIVTIDGESAQDFDDAVGLEALG
ncbi:MAG: hypothetical protein JW937_07710, partial [Candidatus Omnitrophica bacterium]|nr:hypothetical protein [Candidatus Omnitrophota bacterium]